MSVVGVAERFLKKEKVATLRVTRLRTRKILFAQSGLIYRDN